MASSGKMGPNTDKSLLHVSLKHFIPTIHEDELNRPWVWCCLAVPMRHNWETSQKASVCPTIYSQGCNVSNWMNAIKSADPFSAVMCGISITFSVTVLHPIKTHWIENTVVEVPLCSWCEKNNSLVWRFPRHAWKEKVLGSKRLIIISSKTNLWCVSPPAS